MKILVFSIFFHPDDTGIPRYTTDIAEYLNDKDHDVTVVTGFPFYPKWEKRPEDSGRIFREENLDGVRILRNYLYVPKKVNTLKRIVHDVSFLISSFMGFFRAGRHDVIIMEAPPILPGLVAVLFKWLWGANFVIHVQDLQLDAAMSLGMVKNRALTKVLGWIELLQFKMATTVVTITEGMRRLIISKGVDASKVQVVYNWEIPSASVDQPSTTSWFQENYPQHSHCFKIVYSGNLGVKQGLETLIHLAAECQQNPDLQFYVFGAGADRNRLMSIAKEYQLENLVFGAFLESGDYQAMIRECDLAFVSQRTNTGNVFFPSKILEIMRAGKAMMVSADLDSEIAEFVRTAGVGPVRAVDQITEMAEDLQNLQNDTTLLKSYSSNCAEALRQFDRDNALSMLERIVASPHETFEPESVARTRVVANSNAN